MRRSGHRLVGLGRRLLLGSLLLRRGRGGFGQLVGGLRLGLALGPVGGRLHGVGSLVGDLDADSAALSATSPAAWEASCTSASSAAASAVVRATASTACVALRAAVSTVTPAVAATSAVTSAALDTPPRPSPPCPRRRPRRAPSGSPRRRIHRPLRCAAHPLLLPGGVTAPVPQHPCRQGSHGHAYGHESTHDTLLGLSLLVSLPRLHPPRHTDRGLGLRAVGNFEVVAIATDDRLDVATTAKSGPSSAPTSPIRVPDDGGPARRPRTNRWILRRSSTPPWGSRTRSPWWRCR